MKKQTITDFINQKVKSYKSKEDFKIDLDRMIIDLTEDKCSPNQLAYYKRVRNKYNKMFGS